MPLSVKQLQAAQLIGKGNRDKEVYPKVGISEAGFYKWKKQADFIAAIEIFTKAELERNTAIAIAAGEGDDLERSRQDEIFIRQQLRPLVEALCTLATDLIQYTIDEGVESLSPRQIPGLVGAVGDAVKSMRDGNDRLSGLETLLDELSKVEEAVSSKVVAIASGGPSKAA